MNIKRLQTISKRPWRYTEKLRIDYVGAYAKGSNEKIDYAIEVIDKIQELLNRVSMNDTLMKRL